MAGGRQKAAFSLIGTICEVTSLIRGRSGTFGRFARGDDLRFDAISFGDIANGGGDQGLIAVRNGTQADLDGKLGSILAPGVQVEPGAHGTHPDILHVVLTVADVPLAEALRNQHLDAPADDLIMLVAKKGRDLAIG